MGIVYAKESNTPNDFGFPYNKRLQQEKDDFARENEHSGYSNRRSDSIPKRSAVNAEKKSANVRVKARVDKVHVDGLARTKDDIIEAQVAELFKAQDFQDVIVQAHNVRGKLEALGCFKNIGVYIDTSKGPDATPEGVEVTFTVREIKRITGGINTMVGNNEGSIIIEAKAPNIFGRGERLQVEYSCSNKRSTNINVSAIKPFINNSLCKILTASLFSTTTDIPWSGYKQNENGFLFDMILNLGATGSVKHNFQYEANFRDVTPAKQVSFLVREQAGPSLKSALRHICTIEKRNDIVFPTSGSLIQFTTEVAGVGGNIGFVKNEFIMQNNWTLRDFLTFQLGFQSGVLRGISNDMQINIVDRFFLGGPLNLRGFSMRGCGPRHDGNSIGGDFFWALALHLYTPLPIKSGRNSFSNLFRLHGFVNGGNLTNFAFKFDNDYKENLKILTNNVRCTAGGGIAMKLGNVARIELNFIVPLLFARTDLLQQFQFGIGVQYL